MGNKNDPDYLMALMLQKQFEYEASVNNSINNLVYSPPSESKKKENRGSLTDASWELVDPTPNVHVLFVQFNKCFFWNKLLAVTVEWSKRMTSCAGICYYQGRGGLCKISLSEPLLKLRPRKDLVETLLHEMIHAFLFVTHNNKDRDGHGPEFHKHMYRINGEAGTKISVYHTFHDEVKLYQQHWWRCNGRCQKVHPYFGTVRRATNRSPGPNDRWWADHQRMCGGQFIKVREPEKLKAKSSNVKKPVTNSASDIRSYIPVLKEKDNNSRASVSSAGNIVGFKDLNGAKVKGAVRNTSSTIVINKTNIKSATKVNDIETARPKPVNDQTPAKPIEVFSGPGNTLVNASQVSGSDNNDYEVVRKRWLDKFEKPSETNAATTSKKPKIGTPQDFVTCPICDKRIPANELNDHLDKCLLEQSERPKTQNCFICDKKVLESELALHVEDCLQRSSENDNRESEPKMEICVSCGEAVQNLTEHLQKCLEDAFQDSDSSDSTGFKIPCLVCKKQIVASKLNEHLEDECTSFIGGDPSVLDLTNDEDCTEDADEELDGDVAKVPKYNCPFCLEPFYEHEMNAHLDQCLI